MNITQEPIIQGNITDLEYNASNYSNTFKFTLEIEKRTLHVYDSNKEQRTSFKSLVSNVCPNLTSHFKSTNNINIDKIIVYTEPINKDIDIIDIRAYDTNLEEYTSYEINELYSLYVANKEIGVF